MAIFVKLNIQTMLGRKLFCCGTYTEESIGEAGMEIVRNYCEEQDALPLDKKTFPPYFEIIDTDKKIDTPQEFLKVKENEYIGMSAKQLKDLCRQRGFDVKGLNENAELISLLIEDDKAEIEKVTEEEEVESYSFFSCDDFASLSVKEQVEYLEDIFALPSDIDEESDEAIKYSEDLVNAVTAYAGLSLKKTTIEKIKEILDYYAE